MRRGCSQSESCMLDLRSCLSIAAAAAAAATEADFHLTLSPRSLARLLLSHPARDASQRVL